MKKIIGERIRKLRQSKDYTQDNMAAELDITAGAYAKIERGETDPSITRLIQIAGILEVDVAFFLKETTAAISPATDKPTASTAYASRNEVEDLVQLVKKMTKKIDWLESQLQPAKKTAAKKKRT